MGDAFNFQRFANRTVGDESFSVLDFGHISEACGERSFDAFVHSQLVKLFGAVAISGKRFVAKDMASGRDGQLDRFYMCATGRSNRSNIWFALFDRRRPICSRIGNVEILSDLMDDAFRAADNTDHLSSRIPKRFRMALPRKPSTVNQDFQWLTHSSLQNYQQFRVACLQ